MKRKRGICRDGVREKKGTGIREKNEEDDPEMRRIREKKNNDLISCYRVRCPLVREFTTTGALVLGVILTF